MTREAGAWPSTDTWPSRRLPHGAAQFELVRKNSVTPGDSADGQKH